MVKQLRKEIKFEESKEVLKYGGFGHTSVGILAIEDMGCKPRKKKIQPLADLRLVVQQSKT